MGKRVDCHESVDRQVNMNLPHSIKATISEDIYQQLFSELQSEVYSEHNEILTNEGKTEERV